MESMIYVANSKHQPITHWHYLLTEFSVIAHYLRLLVWPSGLNLDPSWPLSTSPLQWQVWSAALLFLTMIGGTWWMSRRYLTDARAKMAFVFTLWFFAHHRGFVGPCSAPGRDGGASHLPAVLGIIIALACLMDALRTRWNWPQTRALQAVLTLVVAFGSVTIHRNLACARVWAYGRTR